MSDLLYTDLHFHFDGSITVKNAKILAKLQNLPLDGETDEELAKIFTVDHTNDLPSFLKCFLPASKLLQRKEGITEAIYLLQEDFRKLGGIYLEIRFAPQFHCFEGLTQEEAILAAIEGLKKSPLKCNLILCLMRRELTEENKQKNIETFNLCKKYLVKKDGVVGLDIAGNEGRFPIELYKDLFLEAKKEGVPFTIHAGEGDGPKSIMGALDLGAKRIGHGIRCVEDEECMDRILKEGAVLEICPYSNFCTNCYPKEKFPEAIKKILKKGIKVTINTDDLGIVCTDIQKEFKYLREEVGLTKEECLQMVKNGIDAAFTSDEDKEELKQMIKDL